MKQTLLRAAIAILLLRLLWMYLIPAWNEITTDFQNYYTAAWAVRHHDPLIDLYDTSWFQRESERAGIENRTALFNYFTPFSALVMWPVANMPPLQAKRVLVVVNLAALAAMAVAAARFLKASRTLILLVALLGGDALGNNFTFGQFYIVLTLLLVCVVIWVERRPALAGWCLSLATAVKLFPAIFVLYLGSLRRWNAIAWALIGSAAFGLLALAMLGWIPYRVYLEEVLPRTLGGEIQDPYNVRWNTLQALLRRALLFEPGLNPHPIANQPLLYFFLRAFVVLAILLVTLVSLRGRRFGFVEYGAVIAAVSLITPSQASYHQILFFPAVAALIHRERDVRRQMTFAVIFALICSNYMGATARWDSGVSMLLAFPRVYLVFGLWFLFLFPPSPSGRGQSAARSASPTGRSLKNGARVRAGFAAIALIALISASIEWQRWQADELDGAVMARPEDHGFLETHPAIGSAGLIFSALRPEGYTVLHPSAFEAGLVYESHGAISGRLPDGTGIRWTGAIEPSLGKASVIAVSEDNHAILERTRNDFAWREVLRRDTVLHDPSISFDRSSVAFSEVANGRYRISEWNRSTGAVRVLLEGSYDYRYPAYAPAGGKLAFATNETGNWDVGEYSFDTAHYEVLTSSRANDYMPAYSPDGKQIYFASDRRRGYRFTAIYTIEVRPS
jgi:hypothetical protein